MTNNDVLRRLRYVFNLNDSKMVEVFGQADCKVNKIQVRSWLAKEEEPEYKNCSDVLLATFLNGFINDRRGKREGDQPVPEKKLTNNIVFVKLKIALNLRTDDIIEIMQLVDFNLSQHELTAFFRKATNKHYRECKDQILRNFLMGIQLKFRGESKPSTQTGESKKGNDQSEKPLKKFDW